MQVSNSSGNSFSFHGSPFSPGLGGTIAQPVMTRIISYFATNQIFYLALIKGKCSLHLVRLNEDT